MDGIALESNGLGFFFFFFSADSISSCNFLVVVKTKTDSCKWLLDKSFLNTVPFNSPLIEEAISYLVRACRDRSLA